ncbi:hypothetical protein HO133_003402 [Letharia lupina]|uniref:Uncharacterized protein n=1 Tax=Letharia lupina TaxID=560253 RepID=A0A8H6CBA1_9LECA|nr:uncharacterized protein HO133_003402 [Letharia lupina]KAF6220270.1 hypothetical protein HO133_003402 [Letharia lupina]
MEATLLQICTCSDKRGSLEGTANWTVFFLAAITLALPLYTAASSQIQSPANRFEDKRTTVSLSQFRQRSSPTPPENSNKKLCLHESIRNGIHTLRNPVATWHGSMIIVDLRTQNDRDHEARSGSMR